MWLIEEIEARETHPLRSLVLRSDRPDLALVLPEDTVPQALHVGIRGASGALIAVGSAAPAVAPFAAPAPTWRLRQMAVHPDFQRQGAGAAVLDGLVNRVIRCAGRSAWLESRESSQAFYQAAGWSTVPGRQHSIGSVAYVDMRLTLLPRLGAPQRLSLGPCPDSSPQSA